MRRATNAFVRLVRFGGISIHALHEESDRVVYGFNVDGDISIHALHEESDQRRVQGRNGPNRDFNPRSP